MQKMNITENNIIGQLVAENYKTATVFKKHKIDFCCKGDRSIQQACQQKGIDKEAILNQLNEAVNLPTGEDPDFKTWPLDLLADYVEKKHHRYIRERIPELKAYLKRVVKVHGAHNPELIEIEKLFLESAEDLENHLQKEEQILFPFIRLMIEKQQSKEALERPHFQTVESPVNMMMHEHDIEGERFRRIAELSSDYSPPEYACNTYRVSFALLQEFEEDLHKHIHLENNILFPKTIELEKTL